MESHRLEGAEEEEEEGAGAGAGAREVCMLCNVIQLCID